MTRRRDGLSDDPLWYKDAVLYELRVRSFFDSNDDGIGDFQGLTAKLDYLVDLGVNTLWLLPFYPSPMRDDGYDIASYTDVHPDYGSLADFRAFLGAAHKRGLRVVTELVINHTSDQHPWFQRARRAPPGSAERDFYVWSDTPERYKDARVIFQDFESSNWFWDPVGKAYYWHRFFAHQPDLNFESPAVKRAVFDALDFWFDLGVDGVRLDAIPYLYEKEGTSCENLSETHAFLQALRAHVDSRYRNRLLLAEANQWPEDAVAYLKPKECHMAFHFPIMPRMFMALRMEDRFPISDILAQTPALDESCQWALFLRNHDELTLEMVTDEERDYMYKVFAREIRMRVNVGIRRRLAPLMGNDRRSIELLNGLLLSLPGTPVLYYGDEIGMGDNVWLGDRDSVRTPMQWTADRNAGFSRANPQRLVLPVIIDPEYHYETVNVEAQANNPSSLLWFMRRMISLRQQFKAFGRGEIRFLHPENPKILAFIRSFEAERILVVANLARSLQAVELDLSAHEEMVPVELLGRNPFPHIGKLPYLLTLAPHGFAMFSIENPAEAQAGASPPFTPPVLSIENGGWGAGPDRALRAGRGSAPGPSGEARGAIEQTLPDWLAQRSWAQEPGRVMRSTQIIDVLCVPGAATACIAILRIGFAENDQETWLLPLDFATGERMGEVRVRWPEAIVAELRFESVNESGESGLVYEALLDPEFCRTLLAAIERRETFPGERGEAVITTTAALPQPPADAGPPRVMRGDHRNALLVFGEKLALKLYRRVEEGPSPEVEMERLLSGRAFRNVPRVGAQVDYRPRRGDTMTLAVVREYVASQADARQYTMDELKRFFERVLAKLEAPAPLPRRALVATILDDAPNELAREMVGLYLDSAELLGRRTAELHLALAAPADDPAFAPEPYSTLYQRSAYQSMRNLSGHVMRQLQAALKSLPEEQRAGAARILARQEEILDRFGDFLRRRAATVRVRCHGDLHLEEVLFTGKDFVFIDFEGDPTRSLTERRRKRSPLRDVASMIRSFQDAAYDALLDQMRLGVAERQHAALEAWANAWQTWAAWACFKGYRETCGAAPFLPRDRGDLRTLLEAFLLEKALSEVGSELLRRPDRVAIPLLGIEQILGPREA